MEKLSSDRPSYVGKVNLTDNGMTTGKVLNGTWDNFDELLESIGSRQLALDGTEHIQFGEQSEQPQLIIVSFEDVPLAVFEHLQNETDEHIEVGIVRRYEVLEGYTHGFKDVCWKFVTAQPIQFKRTDWLTEITFQGKFVDVLDLGN
jgi:hypothetical protein